MPPSPTSSASSRSSGPRTPNTPEFRRTSISGAVVIPSLAEYGDAFNQKPKTSTAERRASHNAVERARRETLNARFLDLAALLPNLKHLRRPSKSAIVNSSVAHVRAARRYRTMASSQLRALNAECDALRREVNAWRARAGMRPTVVPTRDEGFALVLAGDEPPFDPLDLSDFLDEEDDAEFLMASRRRRPAVPSEAICEGPLLLTDPYAPASAASAQPPAPARASSGSPTPTAAAPTTGFHVAIAGSDVVPIFDEAAWLAAAQGW
uniref:Macrophage erythroblast attacher isoform 1 n=1 Tax=Mycena chlorophos TaxID=658473 RepID=A0ABQ0LIB4_MYCCL|nr:macrophage erythroblast attacher isoform 1 [Mycena chlorophos]